MLPEYVRLQEHHVFTQPGKLPSASAGCPKAAQGAHSRARVIILAV